MLSKIQIILYVASQSASRDFYAHLLQQPPTLDVPGMTEFDLPGAKLGLMPETGIARILCPALPHPDQGQGIPRCELYLLVDDPESWMQRALQTGARLVSEVQPRDWGDRAGYVADSDGHVLAFAAESK